MFDNSIILFTFDFNFDLIVEYFVDIYKNCVIFWNGKILVIVY